MAARKTPNKLTTGGRLWGPERVALGMSLATLAKRSGVSGGLISLMENGRMVPSGDEFDAVMRVIRDEQRRQGGNAA